MVFATVLTGRSSSDEDESDEDSFFLLVVRFVGGGTVTFCGTKEGQ